MRYLILLLLACAGFAADDTSLGLGPSPVATSVSGGTVNATSVTDSGLTSGRVTYAGTGGLLKDDSAFTRGTLTFGVDPNTDNVLTTGYGMLGLAPSGTSTAFHIAQASNFNSTDYALKQNSAGFTAVNGKTGQSVQLRIADTQKFSLSSAAASFSAGVPVTISDATVSSTIGTGALIVTGGLGVGGTINVAGNIGLTTNRLLLQAASTSYLGSGIASIYRSGGTITPSAGDVVIQSDPVGTRGFYFAAGTSTSNVASISGTGVITSADTTNTTTAATGSVITSGGIGAAKNIISGMGVHNGVASVVTAAGTTTLTATSVGVQIFTGSTTQTLQMPAANLFGAGISVHYTVINRSTGTVTANRAGSDTFNAAATTFACATLTATEFWSDGVSAWYTK